MLDRSKPLPVTVGWGRETSTVSDTVQKTISPDLGHCLTDHLSDARFYRIRHAYVPTTEKLIHSTAQVPPCENADLRNATGLGDDTRRALEEAGARV